MLLLPCFACVAQAQSNKFRKVAADRAATQAEAVETKAKAKPKAKFGHENGPNPGTGADVFGPTPPSKGGGDRRPGGRDPPPPRDPPATLATAAK